jgi:hypothetical protein
MPRSSVQRNAGSREGGNAHSDAPHDGRRQRGHRRCHGHRTWPRQGDGARQRPHHWRRGTRRQTSSASKTAPGKAAKLCIGAVSNGTRAVAQAGMPTGAHLTMDDNNEDVNVATASKRGLAMRTALGNDRIIGGRGGANDHPGTRILMGRGVAQNLSASRRRRPPGTRRGQK